MTLAIGARRNKDLETTMMSASCVQIHKSKVLSSEQKTCNHTFLPPLPSTIFPVLVSTTLACNHPPRKLSTRLPSPPQAVTATTKPSFCTKLHPSEPEQKGRSMTEVIAIVKAPKKPARMPVAVTPPLVPGGTCRREREVMRRGLEWERMPSSEEKVSAATAA
jgi:hypothetical protein